MQSEGEQVEQLMRMSDNELLSEFLCVLLRPGFELTDQDKRDIHLIDTVFHNRRKAARA
jgi:hypothetical protein